jgi:hypothetical protein
MLCRTRLICLNTASLAASAVLLTITFIFPAFAGIAAEYRHDAAGNVISIERSGTALAINGFSPESGPIGAEVVIYGSGFNSAPSGNAVFFNGIQTPVLYASNASLVVEVPTGATTGPISVNVGANTVTSSSVFTVTDHYAAPEIETFSPSCGAAGTVVTVKGKNFDPAPGATQAGVADIFTNASVANTQELTFSLPAKTATGHVRVSTPSGIANSKGYFFVPPSGSGITCANLESNLTLIAIGQSKAVNIASGIRAALVFDAQADDLLSFYLSDIVKNPSNGFINYYLYDTGGTLWKSGSITGQAATISLPLIPASGTYILSLLVGNSGSVDLSIRMARDPIIEADANPLPLEIEVPGQTRRFGFFAEPGQSLGVGLSQLTYNQASASGTNAQLLGPDGKAYTSNSYTGAGASCFTTPGQCGLNLPIVKQTGIYTVVITPPSIDATLSVKAILSSNTQGYLQADTPYGLALNRIGQDGWLTFDGVKDQSIGVGISGYTANPSNATAAFYVFKPDGTLLKNVTTNGSSAYIEMSPLPATGAYTVWINPSSGGQATMTLLLDAGTLLQADGSSKTTQSADLGGALRFVFDAEIGQSLGIGISNLTYSPTSASGTSVQFLGPDGKSYTSNSYTGSSVTCNVTQKQCDLNLPIVKQTGRHTILLTPPSGITATATATLSNNGQSKLVLNTPYSLTLSRIGQDGWLSFDGIAGESRSLIFSASSIQSPGTSFMAYVFKPDGAFLKSLSLSTSGGKLDLGSLPATGTYQLWINPNYGATVTTTITLQ